MMALMGDAMSSGDIAPARDPLIAQTELERSRDSAARLMENLARKIGAAPAVRDTATGVRRAARYVHRHSENDGVTHVERFLRWRPAFSIGAAVVAGFLVARWLRSR